MRGEAAVVARWLDVEDYPSARLVPETETVCLPRVPSDLLGRASAERLINRLKTERGIATGFHKTHASYLAGLELRASMIWVVVSCKQPLDHDVTNAPSGSSQWEDVRLQGGEQAQVAHLVWLGAPAPSRRKVMSCRRVRSSRMCARGTRM